MAKQILLVDDDFEMLEELSQVFKDKSLTVLTAATGKASLEIAERESFDVALVDIELPDVNGVKLINELRKKRPDAAYLVLTAYASLRSAIEAVREGIFDYVTKPFDPQELLNCVDNALKTRENKTMLPKSNGSVVVENTLENLQYLCNLVSSNGKNGLGEKLHIVFEKMNKLCLDRELRIVELIKEINDLKGRLRSVEGMNRVCVGREARIVELKKEVNNLLERLIEDPKYKG